MESLSETNQTTDRTFQSRGWVLFDHDPELIHWIEHTLPAARRVVNDPLHRQWWRHGNTWFVGVNALENDTDGAIPGGPPLTGKAVAHLNSKPELRDLPLDRAQVSVCYPGYPLSSENESEPNHLYRLRRDAAHVDGLLRHGPDRRRYLGEHHAYILGIPMVDFPSDAAPFVVWEGSHLVVRETFHHLLAQIPPERWPNLDLTEVYHDLRRRIFRQCPRKEIHALPGQCYLVHRMALHGMAPWRSDARGSPDGRMICYFRPELPDPWSWLTLP